VANRADVVIIGAGFAGASAAYHLTARGVRDVVVLESEARPGMHASGKNAALCFQLIENEAEARLAIEGTEIYASPPAELCSRPLLDRRGSLFLAARENLRRLEETKRDGDRLGVATTILSRAEAVHRVPMLAETPFDFALDNPRDGFVDIAALLEGYLRAARAEGARIACGEPVVAIGTSGGRVESVTTARGTITTRTVLNAAGAWAGKVGELAGVGARDVAPRRRHIFRLRGAEPFAPELPFLWHFEQDVYFRPDRGGALTSFCDATPHPASAPAVDVAAEAELRAKLRKSFPRLASLPIEEARACLRTFAADERFLIGREPALDGFFWVAALGGHGMSASYGVGRLAADAVEGIRSKELEHFSPERLARSRWSRVGSDRGED
jgi:D-arginine dehydrogenase